jgi:hypothetical protein
MALVPVGARLQLSHQMPVAADEPALSNADRYVETARAGGRTPNKRCHLVVHILWRHISPIASTQVRKCPRTSGSTMLANEFGHKLLM